MKERLRACEANNMTLITQKNSVDSHLPTDAAGQSLFVVQISDVAARRSRR